MKRRRKAVKRGSPLDQPVKKRAAPAVADLDDFKAPTGERQHLDIPELRAFFSPNVLPETSLWYPYFFIQFFFGCRLSEPALILDEDVSYKKHKIIIRRLKKAQEEDGFLETSYDANERVLKCIETAKKWKVHKGTEENPFLFASNRRRASRDVGAERLSQLRNQDGWQAVSRFTAHRMFQRIAALAKIPEPLRHSHVLRHTRAVMMLVAGEKPEAVQHILGHSSVKMTQRYFLVADVLRRRGVVVDGIGI